MNKRTILVIGLVSLAIITSAFAISSFNSTKGDGGRSLKGETQSSVKNNSETEEQVFGAIPGNEVFSDQFVINGNRFYSYRQAMTTGTTTVCKIRLPSATTTIVSANAAVRTFPNNAAATFSIYAAYRGETGTSSVQAFAGIRTTDGMVTATSSGIGTTTIGSATTTREIIFDVKGTTSPTIAGWCNVLLNEVHP